MSAFLDSHTLSHATVTRATNAVTLRHMPERIATSAELVSRAKVLYFQGLLPSQIADALSLSRVTVRKWVSRHGWKRSLTDAQSIAVTPQKVKMDKGAISIVQVATKPLPGVTHSLRGRLSALVADSVKVLEEKRPTKARELGNTRDREGRASVLKRLTDAAGAIEGWEEQKAPGIVLVGDMRGSAPDERPIVDVSSQLIEPVQDEAAAALVALSEDD